MKNLWLETEGDNWFLRNKEYLGEKDLDMPLSLLTLYSITPQKVLEIGASNGYRLAKIHERYSSPKVTAIEPSKEAIEDGRNKYPFIRFFRNTCEDFNLEEKFDLVIVNFVFHWIYREHLYLCVKKIDDVLEDGGFLILGDFGAEYFFKKEYHHLKDANFSTWKMPYWELFTTSGRYLELAKIRFDHDTHNISTDIHLDNMGTVVLLKKQDLYVEL